jgi:hypothetical protein
MQYNFVAWETKTHYCGIHVKMPDIFLDFNQSKNREQIFHGNFESPISSKSVQLEMR